MMTSKERVYATLNFAGPDRLATDCWVLDIARQGRATEMDALLSRYPTDIGGLAVTNIFNIDYYPVGTATDLWGCEWRTLHHGMIGEVKRSPLDDYARLADYPWPFAALDEGWADAEASLQQQRDKFVLGFAGNLFERMQFLRGVENLYMDLADPDCDGVYVLRDKVKALMRGYVERMVRYDIDAIGFNDDWGSQRDLLISPATWRDFFKPAYQELFDLVRDAGKKIFFHSDGHILAIYADLIDMGVDAINSQVWCMGLEALAPFAGTVTFWGELDRQHLLPHGSPAEITAAAQQMFATFYRNGGLIGQQSFEQVWRLENVEAALAAWQNIKIEDSESA